MWRQSQAKGIYPRDPAAIARFFDGLDLLEPGMVDAHCWRPELADGMVEQGNGSWRVGIGQKPSV
ncbi:hypothetical protein GCM10010411_75970 [Actinomadura fulvescens]|uniref:Uncharacterized protein n=1 Tax=Actinomadura fulvescens TaxID=46160 RepID=A0ABP6CSV5_9ACTN